MNMIYPLDYLCKAKINFDKVKDFDTMYILLESLKDDNFKIYLENLIKESDSFIIFDSSIINDTLCEKNIFKYQNAQWFYDNIFSDITKLNNKINLQKKVIYTICEDCKKLNKNEKVITLNGLVVLQIKHIKITTLIKLINKYKSEDN